MSTFNLTLSRWHHVADRLRRMAQLKSAQSSKVLCNSSLTHAINDEQKQALQERGEQALKDLAFATECIEAVGTIRATLAKENEKQGVSQILTDINTKKSLVDLYKKFDGVDFITMTSLDNINQSIKEKMESNAGANYPYDVNSKSVRVRLVDIKDVPETESKVEFIQSEIASLNDKIAELNAKKVKMELADSLAVSIGLKKSS